MAGYDLFVLIRASLVALFRICGATMATNFSSYSVFFAFMKYGFVRLLSASSSVFVYFTCSIKIHSFDQQRQIQLFLTRFRRNRRSLHAKLRNSFAFNLHDDEKRTLIEDEDKIDWPIGLAPVYTLTNGSWFWHKKNLFWLESNDLPLMGTMKQEMKLTLRSFSLTTVPIEDLIREAAENLKTRQGSNIERFRPGTRNQRQTTLGDPWKILHPSVRSLDTLALPEDLVDRIVGDARNFLSQYQRYKATGIPYRRGYLFNG